MHRHLRTAEGRCQPAADRGGSRDGSLPGPMATAATGAMSPPPLEAAWFEIVERTPLREGPEPPEVTPPPGGGVD